jgi:hypothetical protein
MPLSVTQHARQTVQYGRIIALDIAYSAGIGARRGGRMHAGDGRGQGDDACNQRCSQTRLSHWLRCLPVVPSWAPLGPGARRTRPSRRASIAPSSSRRAIRRQRFEDGALTGVVVNLDHPNPRRGPALKPRGTTHGVFAVKAFVAKALSGLALLGPPKLDKRRHRAGDVHIAAQPRHQRTGARRTCRWCSCGGREIPQGARGRARSVNQMPFVGRA